MTGIVGLLRIALATPSMTYELYLKPTELSIKKMPQASFILQ